MALYTGLQNAAFLTSRDGMTCLHWLKLGGRVSLTRSAAAGHHGRRFYTCTSRSHNAVCPLHTLLSLRRKHFKTSTTSEDKLSHLVKYFSLQSPPPLCPYIKNPVLASFVIFKSPFPRISTAVCPTRHTRILPPRCHRLLLTLSLAPATQHKLQAECRTRSTTSTEHQ